MWFSASLLLALSAPVFAIWPVPVSMTSGSSVLWIKEGVKVTYNGASGGNVCSLPKCYDFRLFSLNSQTKHILAEQGTHGSYQNSTGSITSKDVVQRGITRALNTLFNQNLVPWKLVARNELAQFEPSTNSKRYISSLVITQTTADNSSTFKPLTGTVDETYNLTISTDGKANIIAASSTGVLRALETFIQLFYQHSTGGAYTKLAPVAISDAPRFGHRGLNMDISRNWYPIADIERTIDALSANKFNLLHLHMTDAQAWPIEIPALPELALKGAYQVGLSYSPADIEGLMSYAAYRGIEIVIEFDMPGHTSSIALSHPELIAAYNAEPWATYCAEPPCGSLKLNSSAVYDLLDKLWADVLPRVSKHSSYFHTGGDELNVNAYLLDDTLNTNDSSVIKPYLQKFVDTAHAHVRGAGLTPMVWEEMLLTWNLTLGDDVVVQTWLSDASVASVTSQGHKAIAGNYEFWVRWVSPFI